MRIHVRKHSPNRRRLAHSVAKVGRRVDVDNLVGADEIAQRLGLSSVPRVHELRRRHPDFPPPIKQLKRAMLWYWPDVERWAKATGRLHSG